MLTLPTSAKQWLQGIAVAVISGAASAGVTWMGLNAVHAAGADVAALNFKSLGVVMLTAALFNFLTYLSKSPIPTSTTTVTLTKETTGTGAGDGT